VASTDPGALRFAVLQRRGDIEAAERELARGRLIEAPAPSRGAAATIRRALRRPDPADLLRSDPIKSWDVLRALRALPGIAEPDDPVLDMGSVACPILPALRRQGYRRLHGIDLDPRVRRMPGAEEIDYRVGDLTRTDWPDGRFAAVTAISVIEHGVTLADLLREVARLLRPGGAFVFSTDYWPQKIPTDGVRLFDLPWTIFSAEEIDELVRLAADHGLWPTTDPGAAIRAVDERPIDFAGRSYTFLYGAFERR
jgi:SAM-dependent methyltransferase